MRFEYATIEWLWNENLLRLNLPGGQEHQSAGSYKEVVDLLNRLGSEGWHVAGSVASANWLFWTLERAHS